MELGRDSDTGGQVLTIVSFSYLHVSVCLHAYFFMLVASGVCVSGLSPTCSLQFAVCDNHVLN